MKTPWTLRSSVVQAWVVESWARAPWAVGLWVGLWARVDFRVVVLWVPMELRVVRMEV